MPAAVTPGNALLLVANGAAGSAMTAPAGWTQVSTVSPVNGSMASTLWEKVATATDAGTTVTVTFPTAYHGTVQLLAYSGTNTTQPDRGLREDLGGDARNELLHSGGHRAGER